MATFDISFLNPKLRKQSNNYGYLVDQLSIKQNQLESDGKLSPGDYNLLIGEAQKVASYTGLTPEQRSNVEVKISQFKQLKSTSKLKDTGDISRVNREVQDDMRKNVMLFGSNPQNLIQSNIDALRLKIDQLSNTIDSLQNAGDDSSAHLNEYNDSLNQYNDMLQALSDVQKSDGIKPSSDFVAYVTTNPDGEISDVQISRVGSKSGYAETNGLYGGLQVYGKVNKKENGKNVFKIGNDIFSASDVMIPDPANPLGYRSNPLVSESQMSSAGGGVTTYQRGQYKNLDLGTIKPQTSIRTGGWAEGSNGFLYQKKEDGSYVKYTNVKKDQLGIDDTNIIKIPKTLESNITNYVNQTIDGSRGIQIPTNAPQIPTQSAPTQGGPMQGPQLPQQQQQQSGTSRTPSPEQRAPSTSKGLASTLYEGAKGFLQSLFGGE